LGNDGIVSILFGFARAASSPDSFMGREPNVRFRGKLAHAYGPRTTDNVLWEYTLYFEDGKVGSADDDEFNDMVILTDEGRKLIKPLWSS